MTSHSHALPGRFPSLQLFSVQNHWALPVVEEMVVVVVVVLVVVEAGVVVCVAENS